MARPLYELEAVAKEFDGRHIALRDISITVGQGEQIALIGPSGAGKTTLLRIMNLTLRPTRGTLRFEGVDVGRQNGTDIRDRRRRIGTIYQQHNMVGWLRVVHNVLAGHLGRWSAARGLLSLVWPREVESAAGALTQVGLRDKLYARTDTLSGGQQQRVAIARVLVQDPEVILADEPVSSVDPSLAESIVRLLVELSRANGKTLLMSLHRVDLAVTFFPRVLGIRDGRVWFDLSPDQVSPKVLSALYAGVASAEGPVSVYESVLAVRHACRPLTIAK